MSKDKIEKESGVNDGSYEVKKSKKLNIFAFIACILASFLIWIYVMNTQNADYTKTFTLSVDVLNAEELDAERDLAVYGIPKKDVTVTIKGKKTDVMKYVEKDFRAYLDLSGIKQKGATSLNVAVEAPSASLTVVSVEPTGVDAYVDTPMSKVIVPRPTCGSANDGKLILSLAADTPILEISGPSSYIEKISYAEVVIPYSDYYSIGDNVTTSDIRLYGSDDKELSKEYMTFLKDSFVVKVEQIHEQG